MEQRLLLLLNPIAGQRRGSRSLADIVRVFLDEGYRCETFVTARRGDAAEYAARHAGEFDRVVCIGGDGTLNETIAGVLASGAQVPIGYIPAGTTNDYAASLGLSQDMLEAAHDAVRGRLVELDLGLFNGRPFTYTASCGAFTRASYSAPQSLKNSIGHLAYILEGIRDLPSLRNYRLRVEADGRVLEDDFLFCAITNSLSVGGILKLDSHLVALNDGRFEVMLVHAPKNPGQVSQILYSLTTMDVPSSTVEFFSAEKITVDSEETLEWTLDGEHAEGVTRAEMQNLHSAIRMALPHAVDGEGDRNE